MKPQLYVANRSKSASQARRAPQPGRWRSRKDDDEDENEAPCEPFCRWIPATPGSWILAPDSSVTSSFAARPSVSVAIR